MGSAAPSILTGTVPSRKPTLLHLFPARRTGPARSPPSCAGQAGPPTFFVAAAGSLRRLPFAVVYARPWSAQR
eukprot:6662311-Lingulodinium_polyedra.AAC.1